MTSVFTFSKVSILRIYGSERGVLSYPSVGLYDVDVRYHCPVA